MSLCLSYTMADFPQAVRTNHTQPGPHLSISCDIVCMMMRNGGTILSPEFTTCKAGGGGYLFMADDTIIDPCRLAQLDPSKFWTPALRLRPYSPGNPPDPYWRAHLPPCNLPCTTLCCCTTVHSPSSIEGLGILLHAQQLALVALHAAFALS